MARSKLGNLKTASDLLFEEYLTASKYNWLDEQPVPGKPRTPDYRVLIYGSQFFFEVKEFDAPPPPQPGDGPVWSDPYRPIREKINSAARQFNCYKEFPCALVLANPKRAWVRLEQPYVLIGAMLGNLGVRVPVGKAFGAENRIEKVFLGDGKMVDTKRRKTQNTTISAVIVLSEYPLRYTLNRIAIQDRERTLGRPLFWEELDELLEASPDGPRYRRVRVVVYENPYARIPLNSKLFRGPFDERWAARDGNIARVFAGDELASLEVQLVDGPNSN